MHRFAHVRLFARLGAVALLACLAVTPTGAQDVNLPPIYGSATLAEGFRPDPHRVVVQAGGPVRTNLGGVTAWIAKAPDYRLNYTAGRLPLTFHVESAADTTLLINLPDGTWVANDDGGGALNPLIRLSNPKSGRYEIWVGTVANANAAATLHITELR